MFLMLLFPTSIFIFEAKRQCKKFNEKTNSNPVPIPSLYSSCAFVIYIHSVLNSHLNYGQRYWYEYDAYILGQCTYILNSSYTTLFVGFFWGVVLMYFLLLCMQTNAESLCVRSTNCYCVN